MRPPIPYAWLQTFPLAIERLRLEQLLARLRECAVFLCGHAVENRRKFSSFFVRFSMIRRRRPVIVIVIIIIIIIVQNSSRSSIGSHFELRSFYLGHSDQGSLRRTIFGEAARKNLSLRNKRARGVRCGFRRRSTQRCARMRAWKSLNSECECVLSIRWSGMYYIYYDSKLNVFT